MESTMGRPPFGKVAMTGAERTRLYRRRQAVVKQEQALLRERNQVVLTADAEAIAEKLITMDRRKLRTVHSHISKYLKATAGLPKEKRENQDHLRRNEREWQRHWVAEGRSLADYKAGLSDDESEVWKWRKAKGKAANAAENAAWLRDHPGDPLPEHLCELDYDKAKDAEYHLWQREQTLRRAKQQRKEHTKPR